MSTLKKHAGVALITALLVVSLATILAVSLVDHLHYDIRRTENILRLDQAQLYNTNAIEFGMGLLKLDFDLNNKYDSFEEYSEANEQIFPITGGQISAMILDLQSCFNLNRLSRTSPVFADSRSSYITLLAQLGVEPTQHNLLTDSLVDWLDTDDISETNGAEFDYYIGLEKPYRSANSLLVSPSELRLVKGYTQEVIDLIEDHICVLPNINTAINVNTASAEMLESIKGLSGHGEQIIKDRDASAETTEDDAPFTRLEDFETYVKNTLKVKPKDFDTKQVQVYSEYFLLKSTTYIGAGDITLFSIIYRDQSDGKTQVILQSRGAL